MIAAYAWPQSVLPGEAVELFGSTTSARFDVDVVRRGAGDARVHAGRDRALPALRAGSAQHQLTHAR